ncbi:MAG: S8 family serine peptidase [Sphingomonadaceae bacterium]
MGDETGVAAPKPDGLLLKLRGSAATGFSAEAGALMARGEPVLSLAPADDGFGMAATPATWVRFPASDNPWDEVHALARRGFGVDGAELLAAEPDWQQGFAFEAAAGAPGDCKAAGPKEGGGLPPTPAGDWHLGDGFSQLKRAAAAVPPGEQAKIRIAHLDTGYDPQHRAKPASLETALARSFVAGDPDPHSAVDVTGGGVPGVGAARGHGTGTLGLLAGPGIGGAPGARVLPIRVANGVVIFSTASIAKGFDWALSNRADVLSMSMGGLASKLFADAVNACYAAGMVMVTAAGNNFGGLPIPTIVYPARFRRVVAAVGAMADGKPYADLPLKTMAGCYGPMSKMGTAVAGFTPNVPWPRIGCPDTIDRDGAGTSSATPQVAAAAALWLAKHRAALAALPEAWMRGEAARRALFASASRAAAGQPADLRLGQGLLRAFDLLAVQPAAAASFRPTERADAGWDVLKLLSGRGLGVSGGRMPGDEMLELELVQLAQRDPALAGLLPDPEAGASEAEARRFLEAAAEHPGASRSLAFALRRALAGDGPVAAPFPRVPPAPPAGPAPAPAAASATAGSPVPARRRLAIYARDPTLGASLDSFEANVATVEVRHEPELMPGPVGDYVEVVDIDPASDRVYPPADLNDLNLALSDGFRPSEGNPGFHQQMVYAVIMRVVDAFEQALGRRLLWGGTSRFIRRLRVYPHALRQANAYYSPDKVALLFGYFPARSKLGDRTPEGTMVFTCLSADIIAHETTHAVLDGQAPPFRDPSNPDVLAFHEGFADIVALFQQFTIPDLVRREVARARGDLRGASLLGSLAAQFGEGLGKSGPLRQYLTLPDDVAYGRTTAVHTLGSILVAAVYHAFLAIVDRRSSRLVRLATGGSGRLPDGHLHPDLVDALTAEVVRAAADVQKMCIRAIDYLPPVDLTFGDYLRAIITADVDSWPMDESGYRVAFLEAFRAFGLLPRTLRTVSVETLVWGPPAERAPAGLAALVEALNFRPGPVRSRQEIHELAQMRQAAVAEHLGRMLAEDPGLHGLLGLEPGLGRFDRNGKPMAADGGTGGSGTNFYVDAVRIKRRELAERTGPPREAFDVIVRVRQRRPELLDPASPALGRFWFRGGATLIIDPFCEDGTPRIRHAIRRAMTDRDRLGRERAWRQQRSAADLRAAYFGAEDDPGQPLAGAEPFRLLHAHREED